MDCNIQSKPSIFLLMGLKNNQNRSLKRTASVISSDPPCKADNARFTTLPLKALSDQI